MSNPRLYQIEYRRVLDVGIARDGWQRLPTRVEEGHESDILIPDLELDATYDVRVRFVEDDGAAVSDWVLWPGVKVVKPAGVPPAVPTLRSTKNDCLVWEPLTEVLDLHGYRVRHAPSVHERWDTAEPAHEDLVTAPPFLLCRVPRGIRTLWIKAVDQDGNESASATSVVLDRGPFDDVEEFALRTVDEKALGFPGLKKGATVQAAGLVASAVVGTQPMFPSGVEWWTSADGASPFFSTDVEAGMFGEFWRGNAEWFSRDGSLPMFGGLYQWTEYVWSFTVHSDEEGERSVLSANVACGGIGWRLLYREKNPTLWLSANPYDKMFSTTGADPMFPAQTPKPWRPWPGRLRPVRAAIYDFRLVVPGGSEQFSITALSVTVSSAARVRHVLGLSVPALGGTRVPPDDEWRSLQEVRAVPIGALVDRHVVPSDRNRSKGPWLQTFDASGVAVAQTVDVLLRGY